MCAAHNLDSVAQQMNSMGQVAKVAVIQLMSPIEILTSYISCSGTSSKQVYGGYYEAWNYQHACDVLAPSNIDMVPWTFSQLLFYSFAGINTGNSEIETMFAHDESYMKDIVALKKKKDNLKVFISVGGWDLGGEPFSDMVRFSGTRKAFINSATSFMEKHGFDGIDIDWEYPAASDRGGRDEDSKNFVTFLKELKAACGDHYQITTTLPSSYWYLKGFYIKFIEEGFIWKIWKMPRRAL
ncbi:uncharacterized protein N7469_006634 [Penicillium citrinum]|uniref:chitinase n=1 Tax=Penicillium citrinum TaxID=5077 RepID=A0A9W9NX67_PENCI|nr:uncharacterized protein N7469_006634 [Penicillium citrinum]KAJ5226628.1 hypothetical protein N7469_006634 [Penicillium citrinum]